VSRDGVERPDWLRYEQEVARLLARLDPGAVVEHHVRARGLLSGYPREIDVRVTGAVAGYTFVIAVECKHLGRPVGVDVVESFASKLTDIAAELGVLVSSSGFTEVARRWAAHARCPRVELRHKPLLQSIASQRGHTSKDGDPQGAYRSSDLTTALSRPGFDFAFRGCRPPAGRTWRYQEARLVELDRDGRLLWLSNGMPTLKRFSSNLPHKSK
jgi:hypothetical protein